MSECSSGAVISGTCTLRHKIDVPSNGTRERIVPPIQRSTATTFCVPPKRSESIQRSNKRNKANEGTRTNQEKLCHYCQQACMADTLSLTSSTDPRLMIERVEVEVMTWSNIEPLPSCDMPPAASTMNASGAHS